jgi:hypothetical protein
VFKAFQFHLMIKTDLRYGTTAGTAVEKEMLLKEHLCARTGHTRPLSISGWAVFCDRSREKRRRRVASTANTNPMVRTLLKASMKYDY